MAVRPGGKLVGSGGGSSGLFGQEHIVLSSFILEVADAVMCMGYAGIVGNPVGRAPRSTRVSLDRNEDVILSER